MPSVLLTPKHPNVSPAISLSRSLPSCPLCALLESNKRFRCSSSCSSACNAPPPHICKAHSLTLFMSSFECHLLDKAHPTLTTPFKTSEASLTRTAIHPYLYFIFFTVLTDYVINIPIVCIIYCLSPPAKKESSLRAEIFVCVGDRGKPNSWNSAWHPRGTDDFANMSE